MELENLKKGKAIVEKCVEELFSKDDLTPAETKAALDGMMLRGMLCEEIDDCKMREERGERGYSGYGAPRHYTMTAYGPQPRDAMGRYSGEPMYGYGGWYEDRPMAYNGPMMDQSWCYNEGSYGMRQNDYSRHSIGDRAVEQLERLMDKAQSDYEKEELHKFIRMIRQAAD